MTFVSSVLIIVSIVVTTVGVTIPAAALAVQTGNNYNITTIQIPITHFLNLHSFSDIKLYLNSTDGHYHVKGLLKNTLHETVFTDTILTIDFDDKSTGQILLANATTVNGPIVPGGSAPFDMATPYKQKDTSQFQFMKLDVS